MNSLPGGVSEDLGSRFEQNLLGDWLTNDTYPVRMYPADLVGAVDSVARFHRPLIRRGEHGQRRGSLEFRERRLQ